MGLADERPQPERERIHLVEKQLRREQKGWRMAVTGWVVVAFAVLAAIFVPQDLRLGGVGILVIAAALGIAGLVLAVIGSVQSDKGLPEERE